MVKPNIGDFGPDNKTRTALEVGDICIAATYREGEVDIRRNVGEGRVLVLSADLTPKGALWTDEQGLILGLAYDPSSETLLVSDAGSQTIKRFSKNGEMLSPFSAMQGKPFGPIVATGDGGLVIGEHIKGDKFPFLGGGAIYRFGADGTELGCHKADHDKGKFGFHGVTNMAVVDGGRRAIYISETGKRVMQYDLVADKQMDDLFVLDEDGEKVTAGFAIDESGNILLSHVYGVSLMTTAGDVIQDYDIAKERGWSAVKILADKTHFLISNFFTGRIEKRYLKTGALVAEIDTGMAFRVACMAEIM